ncbi:MAG: DMT family transporter [Deltaproteobacteria bacterium]|nr:DMT family transporter [Deltaproteobacteria bacterium]
MLWLPLSLVAAFTLATTDALTKRFFSELSPYEMAMLRLLYTLPWLIFSLFFIPLVIPRNGYFIAVASAVPLEICALYCYMKAIKASPLSITLPFLAFTPAFIILTGRILLGEQLHFMGIIGIALIVAGSYCLNISSVKEGLFSPIKAVFREQGSWLMLLVSFIYSITSVLGKIGVINSNPYFFGSTYFIVLSLVMSALIPLSPGTSVKRLIQKPLKGIILGAAYSIMIFSHMLAISQVEAAYMVSVKRLSLLIGIFYGAWWFREERTGERLFGAVIMLAGVFLIGFSS